MTRVRSELSLLESVFHMFPGFERYGAELKAADYELSNPHAWLTAIERRPDVPIALWEAVVQCKAAIRDERFREMFELTVAKLHGVEDLAPR